MKVDFTVDATEIDLIVDRLKAEEQHIEKAVSRAIIKTSRWMQTTAKRSLAKLLGTSIGKIKGRALNIGNGKHRVAALWLGSNPIQAKYLKAKQRASGVVVPYNGQVFSNAFQAPDVSLSGKTTNKHFFERVGGDTYPIKLLEIDVAEEVDVVIIRKVQGMVAERFYTIFEQELNYERIRNQ